MSGDNPDRIDLGDSEEEEDVAGQQADGEGEEACGESGGTSRGGGAKGGEKKRKRLAKLKELRLKRNEARKKNHQEVVEEDQRSKLPANWEAKKRRLEKELEEEKEREACEARGEDYDRLKNLKVTVEQAEMEEKKKSRKVKDEGWSDFRNAAIQKYNRLTSNMKPDLVAYEKNKEEWGEDFYCSANSLTHGQHGKVSEEAVERLKQDVQKQIEKSSKSSRRRKVYEDSDISYINERNRRFNEKADRFYSEYTKEIRENLERGTAL
eukprot:Nk52_evm71s239 gene=Nk52_evmTU71s239